MRYREEEEEEEKVVVGKLIDGDTKKYDQAYMGKRKRKR